MEHDGLRLLARCALLAFGIAIGPLVLLAGLTSDTWQGRAVVVLCLSGFGLACYAATERPRFRYADAFAGLCGTGFLLSLVAVIWNTPSGQPAQSAKVGHLWEDQHEHRRWVLGNVVPEVDQFRLGFELVPALDPLFTRKQAVALKQDTTRIYRELEADADFAALGSVMPLAYDEIWGRRPAVSHAYIFDGRAGSGPAPLLIFFHGSGGNFKAYTWLLRRVAEHTGAVLVAPSYGLGNWTEASSQGAVDLVLGQLERSSIAVDRSQMHLIGLSNGGLAVSHLCTQQDNRWRSAMLISPVVPHRSKSDWRPKP
jgi:hypothetical protein